MKSHFDEDKVAFGKINELMIINGDHMSSFRRDLTKIMQTLEKQDATYADHRKSMAEHIARVEPMISSYERDFIVSSANGALLKKWSIRLGLLASIIGSWYVIKAFIVSTLFK